MKLAYNILLPVVQGLLAAVLVAMGFARLLAWSALYWANELVYFMAAALILGGHQFLLGWGYKKQLLCPVAVRALGAVDYILFSLQLAAMGFGLLWEVAAPLLREDRTFSPISLAVFLPVMAVDILAMVLRKRSTEHCLYIAP